jgi:hypothetical protein
VSETIHVTCGHCALNEALSIRLRDIVSLRDNLSCGPLAPLDDLDRWCAMRLAFWDHPGGKAANNRRRRPRSNDVARVELLGRLDRLANASEVRIWLGTGLEDQLALAWLPQLLRAIGGRAQELRLLQFERTADGKAISTLGIMNPSEFQEHPDPHLIDGAEFAYLEKAWSAVTASDPIALMSFLGQASGPLPLLRAALSKILWRYPDIRSGLNRYEIQLLASTQKDGPTVARVIASTMKAFFFEDNECVGDNWLFWRLRHLAEPTLPHPAVTLTGERSTIRGTEARLTPAGERFLNAEFNFAVVNGIDDWVAGVHLDSRVGDVWFRQGRTVVHH